MFGVRYVKSSPSHYLLQYKDGKVVREGTGLAFFYFAPASTLVSVPLNAVDVPFMFEETTRDFQAVTLQGQVAYRIALWQSSRILCCSPMALTHRKIRSGCRCGY
jgi:hypothetical protein